MNWRTDPNAEQVLRGHGIDFEYRTVTCNSIDRERSKKNHARKHKLKAAAAEDYARAMRDGDTFPAIAMREIVDGSYVIAGGTHRFVAANEINNEEDVYAIIFSCDDIEFDVIATELNAVEGMRTDTDERIERAADWVEKHSVTIEEAAKYMRVSVGSVSRLRRAREAKKQAATLGIDLPATTPISHLDELSKFSGDEPTFGAVATIIKNGSRALTGDDLKAAVRRIKERGNEADRVELAQSIAKKFGDLNKPRRIKKPVRVAIFRGITTLENALAKCPTEQKAQLDEADKEELKKKWSCLPEWWNLLLRESGAGRSVNGSRKRKS